MKHSENDSLYALSISHHSHRPSSSSDFTKRSFYEVGGSQATPKFRLLNLKEVKQFIEILFHTGHCSRISLPPARGEVPDCGIITPICFAVFRDSMKVLFCDLV